MLQDECSDMPKNWNRRFKHNRDKIKTGDIYELAEVVRNLAIREAEKGLSTGEKQMFTRAKKILASELMYALEMGEDEAEEHLDELLADVRRRQGGGRREVAAGSDRKRKMAVALLVAAGRGERLGAEGPKAFVVLAGRPMLEWSLDALRRVPAVARDRRRAAAEGARRPRGVIGVAGGAERSHSVRTALEAAGAGPGDEPVIVHDAARPLADARAVRARRSRRWRRAGADAASRPRA